MTTVQQWGGGVLWEVKSGVLLRGGPTVLLSSSISGGTNLHVLRPRP